MSEYYLNKVKKCVTFIFENRNPLIALGTGFFVGIQTEFGDAVYLITAKHVLENKSGNLIDSILYRLNTKNGSSSYIQLDLQDHVLLTHPDNDVDLIAILQYPPPEEYDYLIISENYFTNDKILSEKNIKEGSKVFYPGLFTGIYSDFYQEQRNYPILRFGAISFLSTEKISFIERKVRKSAYLYMIESLSIGGFSGSPVFFETPQINRTKILYAPEIYLGGIIKGHYNDIAETPNGIIRQLNMGLAMVTPCYILKEILDSDKAKQHMKEISNRE